jgi:hypothetical protein
LRLIHRQRGPGLEIGRAVRRAAEPRRFRPAPDHRNRPTRCAT